MAKLTGVRVKDASEKWRNSGTLQLVHLCAV